MSDFWDTVSGYVGDAADFLLGNQMGSPHGTTGKTGVLEDVYEFGKTVYGYADSFLSSDVGQFVKEGAKAYIASRDEEDGKRLFQAPQIEAPNIKRSASTVSVAGLAALRNPVGVNNPQVQTAIRRMSSRNNFNPQLQKIMQQNMTARQGRRTLGVGSASLPRVAVTPAAAVRKEATTV